MIEYNEIYNKQRIYVAICWSQDKDIVLLDTKIHYFHRRHKYEGIQLRFKWERKEQLCLEYLILLPLLALSNVKYTPSQLETFIYYLYILSTAGNLMAH